MDKETENEPMISNQEKCVNLSTRKKDDWTYAIAGLVDEPETTKVAYSILRKKYGIRFRIGDLSSWIKGTYHKRQIIRFSLRKI